ncbi:VOC family protein [Streptomyces fuscigenes]|uniref:VOC family protein n=1 Tax=Streptomyces fuscigenes TaxID=1528880 RepID=UPI001F2226F9|nr:VOC family protein [Streptomyces fuscigenes]MCF3963350.1 VOC family protein [Streptomyces fuscigenes]
MNVTLSAVIIESGDLDAESAFWHGLLGGSVTRTPEHHFLRAEGLPAFVVHLAPGHVPPRWPEGPSQQMHVDLAVDDLDAADRAALAAGARRLSPADGAAAARSRVYASPAGHPFCLRAA